VKQKFIKFQENVHGKDQAKNWLQKIPQIIEELKIKWDLEIGDEFELSYNYVISVKRKNGELAVLKIYFPDDPEFVNQLAFLKTVNGKGAIKVLETDEKNFAVLLEQCVPGNTLSSLNNEVKETNIFCEVVKQTWIKSPADHDFPGIEKEIEDFDWYLKNYDQFNDYIDTETIIKARQKYAKLLNTQTDLYLLHSDLHHENILESERGWLAIDPKGVLAEREYEVNAFLRNPIKRAENNLLTKEILVKRLDIIARKLDLNRQRIIDWCFCQTLLSIIWGLQTNNGRAEYWYKIAKELENLK